MSEDEKGSDFDARLLFVKASESDGLVLKEETKDEKESNSSHSNEGETIEEGVIIGINVSTISVSGGFDDGVAQIVDTGSQVVDGIHNISDQEDDNTIVIVSQPSIVELFFEGVVVEVGVRGGGSVNSKSLKVHFRRDEDNEIKR